MTGVDSSDTQHNEAAVKSTTESAIEGVAGYDVGPHVSESLVESNSRKPTATAMQESVAADSEGNLYSENPFADTNGRDGQVEGAPNSPSRPVEPNEQITGSVPPEIEGLKAMFPDFDVAILQSVLESVAGNQERAADVLLGMSDPSYQPQQQPGQSQTELDEEYARRLMYEEQQRHRTRWDPSNRQEANGGRIPFSDYHGPPPQQQGGYYDARGQWNDQTNGKDTMTEVQEQFSKLAETGKKTFSSLVTKVKAKMQEFDQSRNPSSSSSQTSWGLGTPGAYTNQDSSSQTQGGYYAPPATHSVNTAPETFRPDSPPVFPSSVSTPVPPSERIPPRPSSTGPPPAGNVDPAKVGMLPKRVSVLGTTPPQSNARHDEDDELDYVENPFGEERK